MSNYLVNLVRKLPAKLFTQSQKNILRNLADYADDDGTKIYPSIETIAQDTGLSTRMVMISTKALVEMGYVAKFRIYKNGKVMRNTYTLNVNKLLKEIPMKSTKEKAVDKLVDKPVENKISSEMVSRLSSEMISPLSSEMISPKHQYNINKKHQVMDNNEMDLRIAVLECLSSLGVNDKEVLRWINEHGLHKIKAKLHEMNDSILSNRTKVRNPGAYLRHMLEGRYRVA